MSSNITTILQNWTATEGGQVTPLDNGLINETFKVTNPKGEKYLLQKVNTQIFKAPDKIAENVATIAKHLKSKQYTKKIVEFVPNTEGVATTWHEGEAWRLSYFFDETQTLLTIQNPYIAQAAAAAFGEYARFLSDIPTANIHTILPNFHNIDFRILQFENLLSNEIVCEKRLKNADKILKINEKYLSIFKHLNLNVPPRICHNDTKIANILFKKDQAFCIIDLDTLQVGALWADFGDMVRTYTPTFDENEPDFSKIVMRLPYFEAIVKGFLGELQPILTKEERETLILGARMLVYEQALRFLTDYLANDIYYMTNYENHNLVRANNQFALLQSIDNQLVEIGHALSK